MTLGVNLRKSRLKRLSPKMNNLLIIVGEEIRNRPQEEAKEEAMADFRAAEAMAALEEAVAKIAASEVEAAMIEEDIEAVVAMITSEVAAAENTKLTTLTLEGVVAAIGAVEVAVSTATTTTAKVVADIAADSTTQKVAEDAEMLDSEEEEVEQTSILTMTSMERAVVRA